MLTRYASVTDLPAAIPVFPLAGAILLPRAELPLNIFEPRYLKMIDDVIRNQRIIGIIQPVGDGGTTGSPQSRTAEIAAVGCAGRLTSFQELPDGRMLIVLTGIVRFRPAAELAATTPYRIFSADYAPFADDLKRGEGEDEVDRERLIETLRRFLGRRQATADWKRIAETPTEQLVNWLSLASPFDAQEKQALLEAPTLAARAEMLMSLAEMDAASGPGNPGNRLQ
jgi:Lon protease-like protein